MELSNIESAHFTQVHNFAQHFVSIYCCLGFGYLAFCQFKNIPSRQGQVPDWDNQKDMELHQIDEVDDHFEGIESLGLGEGDSIYFTPSGTPLR